MAPIEPVTQSVVVEAEADPSAAVSKAASNSNSASASASPHSSLDDTLWYDAESDPSRPASALSREGTDEFFDARPFRTPTPATDQKLLPSETCATITSEGRSKLLQPRKRLLGYQSATIGTGKSGIECCCIAPDHLTMATGGRDRLVKLWTPTRPSQSVAAVAASPSARTAATAMKTVKFAPNDDAPNTSKRKRRQEPPWKCVAELRGHCGWVRCVAFSPSGLLCSGSGGRCNTIRLWDPLVNWECTAVLDDHTGWVRDLAFAPTASSSSGSRGARPHLFSASNDSTLRVWDVATAAEVGSKPTAVLRGHTAAVLTCCAIPSEQSLLLSGSADKTHRVWDARTGNCLRTITVATNARGAQSGGLGSFGCDGAGVVHTCTAWASTAPAATATTAAEGARGKLAATPVQIMAVAGCSKGSLTTWFLGGEGGGGSSIQSEDAWCPTHSFETGTAPNHEGARRARKRLENNSAFSGQSDESQKGRVITGGDDGKLRVWERSTSGGGWRLAAAELCGHTAAVVGIVTGSNGSIASVSRDGSFRWWTRTEAPLEADSMVAVGMEARADAACTGLSTRVVPLAAPSILPDALGAVAAAGRSLASRGPLDGTTNIGLTPARSPPARSPPASGAAYGRGVLLSNTPFGGIVYGSNTSPFRASTASAASSPPARFSTPNLEPNPPPPLVPTEERGAGAGERCTDAAANVAPTSERAQFAASEEVDHDAADATARDADCSNQPPLEDDNGDWRINRTITLRAPTRPQDATAELIATPGRYGMLLFKDAVGRRTMVREVVLGSAAHAAGVYAGDVVVVVDGKHLAGCSHGHVMEAVRSADDGIVLTVSTVAAQLSKHAALVRAASIAAGIQAPEKAPTTVAPAPAPAPATGPESPAAAVAAAVVSAAPPLPPSTPKPKATPSDPARPAQSSLSDVGVSVSKASAKPSRPARPIYPSSHLSAVASPAAEFSTTSPDKWPTPPSNPQRTFRHSVAHPTAESYAAAEAYLTDGIGNLGGIDGGTVDETAGTAAAPSSSSSSSSSWFATTAASSSASSSNKKPLDVQLKDASGWETRAGARGGKGGAVARATDARRIVLLRNAEADYEANVERATIALQDAVAQLENTEAEYAARVARVLAGDAAVMPQSSLPPRSAGAGSGRTAPPTLPQVGSPNNPKSSFAAPGMPPDPKCNACLVPLGTRSGVLVPRKALGVTNPKTKDTHVRICLDCTASHVDVGALRLVGFCA